MFPLRDNIPSRRTPIVNYTLILLNVLVFLWEISLPQWQLQHTTQELGLVPARLLQTEFAPPSQVPFFVPIFSSMFLHGGFLHLFGNMWFLYIFGDNVEDALGSARYLLFYLSSGVAAAFVQVLLNATSTTPMIGASGAISGVLGGYFRLYPRARVLTLVPIFFFFQFIELPALLFLGFWFLLQISSGTASLGASGGVAWWAHVGGFLAGAWLVKKFLDRQYGPWRYE